MKYTIEVPEVHIATHEVVADSTDEALEKIKMGESIILAFEYSHLLEVKNIIEEDIVTNNNNYPENYRGYKPLNKWMDKFELTEGRRSNANIKKS